jgi:hypothetical protein
MLRLERHPMPTMQCPVCKTDNEPARTTCVSCQSALPAPTPSARPKRRSRRGAGKQPDATASPRAAAYNRDVKRVYRLCLIGVLPFLGLILGPLSAFIAARIRLRAKDDPDFTLHTPVRFVFIIGLLTAIANWVGLTLMILGLWS